MDRPSENTTCQTRLRHDVVFLCRREGRVTEQVFDTFHIAGILTRPEAGRYASDNLASIQTALSEARSFDQSGKESECTDAIARAKRLAG